MDAPRSEPPQRPATVRAMRWAVPLVGVALLVVPRVPPIVPLVVGIALALLFENPWPKETKILARRALTWSVVGLGAGASLPVVATVGARGLLFGAASIAFSLAFGIWLGRRLGVRDDASLLVAVGTAICGGSAIAAVAPAIRAREADVSVALVTVFVLNAVALVVFPFLGRLAGLDATAYGLFCAIAIHDTSSVVGAASRYGGAALEVAVAAKLARSLWIVPVTLVLASRARRARAAEPTEETGPGGKSATPWFILGFVLVSALFSWAPRLHPVAEVVTLVARRLLGATLFLVGLGLSRASLRAVGLRPLVQGVILWAAVTVLALGAVATATVH